MSRQRIVVRRCEGKARGSCAVDVSGGASGAIAYLQTGLRGVRLGCFDV